MATLQTERNGKKGKRWRARVKFLGEEHYLGTFKTKEEAEEVERNYNAYLTEQHGPPSLRGYNTSDQRSERLRRRRSR